MYGDERETRIGGETGGHLGGGDRAGFPGLAVVLGLKEGLAGAEKEAWGGERRSGLGMCP